MTVVLIGATLPENREIDTQVVSKADFIVCDVPEEVSKEPGDMIAARAEDIAYEQKTFSLNALMTGPADSMANACDAVQTDLNFLMKK